MSIVTVIIPILDAMPYLTEALASLEAQTFRNFEVCLWDNGSIDGSVEEAKRWIPGRLPGRVVTGCPLPLHECLAKMVEEARTEFVARMDGDDWIPSERFELQLSALNFDNKLIGIGGQLEIMDSTGKRIGDLPYPISYAAVLGRLLSSSPLPHAAMVMRREAIIACGNYKYPQPIEDFDLWFRFLQKGPVICLNKLVYKYRILGSGITEQAKKAERHNIALFECLRRNVPEFFNIPAEAFEKLYRKKHPMAFLPLSRAAATISRLSEIEMKSVLACPEFLFSARCYTARWDLCSKVVYRLWEQRYKNNALLKLSGRN